MTGWLAGCLACCRPKRENLVLLPAGPDFDASKWISDPDKVNLLSLVLNVSARCLVFHGGGVGGGAGGWLPGRLFTGCAMGGPKE